MSNTIYVNKLIKNEITNKNSKNKPVTIKTILFISLFCSINETAFTVKNNINTEIIKENVPKFFKILKSYLIKKYGDNLNINIETGEY